MTTKDYRVETEAAQIAQAQHNALAKFAMGGNLFVTVIVIGAMWADSGSATVAVISGVAFFLGFGALVILTLSGTLREVWVNGQNQRTMRELHQLQYYVQVEEAQRVTVVDRPRLERGEATAPMQLPDSPRFVPAVPRTKDSVKAEAAAFVRHLFDGEGKPISTKITPRKAQIQHPSPTPDTVEYLLGLEIVRRGERGQLYWNTDEYSGYPNMHSAIEAIRTGVRRVSYRVGVGPGDSMGERAA